MKENRFGWRHSLANVNRLLSCFCLCFWVVSAIVRSALCEKGCISIIMMTEKSQLSLGASSSWLWCMSLSPARLCWCMSMRKRFPSMPKQPCPPQKVWDCQQVEISRADLQQLSVGNYDITQCFQAMDTKKHSILGRGRLTYLTKMCAETSISDGCTRQLWRTWSC